MIIDDSNNSNNNNNNNKESSVKEGLDSKRNTNISIAPPSNMRLPVPSIQPTTNRSTQISLLSTKRNTTVSTTDTSSNKKVNLFYKLFLFLYQLFYLTILMMVFNRSLIHHVDQQSFYSEIPGQITTISNVSDNRSLLSLHIQCSGQGPITVLFESGLFVSSTFLWSESYKRTSRITKACIYDRAGYGWSEMGSLPRSPEQELKEFTELLHQSNLDGPFLLVSHSYGSLLSMLYAVNHPGAVVGMVLIEPFLPTEAFMMKDMDRSSSNYLLYNFEGLLPRLFWSGLGSAMAMDIFSIPSIESMIGLPINILTDGDERKIIRNNNLYKTVYSELVSYLTTFSNQQHSTNENQNLNNNGNSQNNNNGTIAWASLEPGERGEGRGEEEEEGNEMKGLESLETLASQEILERIPTKIIIGEQTTTTGQSFCHGRQGIVNGECVRKTECNEEYLKQVQTFCHWENCTVKIAENSSAYVPLDRLDIVISDIYSMIIDDSNNSNNNNNNNKESSVKEGLDSKRNTNISIAPPSNMRLPVPSIQPTTNRSTQISLLSTKRNTTVSTTDTSSNKKVNLFYKLFLSSTNSSI